MDIDPLEEMEMIEADPNVCPTCHTSYINGTCAGHCTQKTNWILGPDDQAIVAHLVADYRNATPEKAMELMKIHHDRLGGLSSRRLALLRELQAIDRAIAMRTAFVSSALGVTS
jgi:hypothetical protein